MFLLIKHGQGARPASDDNDLLKTQFQELLSKNLSRRESQRVSCLTCGSPTDCADYCGLHSSNYRCDFKKINKSGKVSETKICSKTAVFGTCFCSVHYAERRKEIMRSFFKDNHMYIPKELPLESFDHILDRSWEEFNRLLTREDLTSSLNTLSMIVWIEHSGAEINLERVKAAFEEEGDYLGADGAASFVNVKEFVAVFEGDDSKLYNASVKIWNNNQIQISGCKSITSALRVISSVIRTLKAIGELTGDVRVSTIKPVFANASFDFFPRPVAISRMQSRGFLEGLEHELSGLGVDVELTPHRDLYVQFVFSRLVVGGGGDKLKTTVKIYPKGNVIITFNNFDGLLLKQGLQSLTKTSDRLQVFMSSGSLNICLEPSPMFFLSNTSERFLFSPVSGKKRKFEL